MTREEWMDAFDKLFDGPKLIQMTELRPKLQAIQDLKKPSASDMLHWISCASDPKSCPILPGDSRVHPVVKFHGEP